MMVLLILAKPGTNPFVKFESESSYFISRPVLGMCLSVIYSEVVKGTDSYAISRM